MLKKNKSQIQSEIPFLMMLNCSWQWTSVMEGSDMADGDHHMLPGV